MTEQESTFPIIKKELCTDLESNLKNYTKKELQEVADSLGTILVKSWKKQKQIEFLYDEILTQVETIYKPVIEEVYELFSNDLKQVLTFKEPKQLNILAPFIQKGFFFAGMDKEKLILVIPDEIWNSTRVEKQKEEKLHPAFNVLNDWHNTATAIYGKTNHEHLAYVWNKYNKSKLTSEEILYILERNVIN